MRVADLADSTASPTRPDGEFFNRTNRACQVQSEKFNLFCPLAAAGSLAHNSRPTQGTQVPVR
jgi:hypothetical protein